MPGGFNGTGTFVRAHNWTQDKNNNFPITASRFDEEDDAFATGLSTCITKDGQTTVTANIPMNSHKFTGLAVGNARTDSITLGQVQDNQFLDLGTLGGAADAYTGSPSPVVTAYAATMRFTAKINATNLTTTPYLQLSGIASPASNAVIKKIDSSGSEIAVEVGDLIIGMVGDFKRNTSNNAWIILNPLSQESGVFKKLVISPAASYTIASGAITITSSSIIVDTEGSAATDDLDTINGLTDGEIVYIRIANDARNVVLKHNTGNIYNPNGLDVVLDLTTDLVEAKYDSSLSKLIISSISTPGNAPLQLLATKIASTSSSLNFTDYINSSFSKYIFELINIIPATDDVTLSVRFSVDGGSNYITANYVGGAAAGSPADNPTGVTSNTDRIDITNKNAGFRVSNAATNGISGSIIINDPSSTASYKSIQRSVSYDNTSGNYTYLVGNGRYEGAATAVNAVQFLFTSGDIASGTIKLYGLK